MICLTPREQNYITTTIPKDRSGRLPYTNGDRSSIVAKARQLNGDYRLGGEPAYGEESRNVTFFILRLCEELRRINVRLMP